MILSFLIISAILTRGKYQPREVMLKCKAGIQLQTEVV